MELEKVVQEEFNNLVESGKVKEIIAKNLENTVQEIFKSSLREYSDFGKELQAVVKEALKVDLTKISLLGYQQIVTDIVKEQLEAHVLTQVAAPIEEALKVILTPFEKRIYKLSEIVEKFKECEIEESEGELTLIVEHSSYGSIHIGIDESDRKDSVWNCDYRFSLDKTDKRIYSFESERSLSKDLTKKSLGRGFTKYLFNLYASQCTIEVDESNCETEWYND